MRKAGGTVIREKIVVAPGVKTGAQACVVKNIGEFDITVAGVPAKKLSDHSFCR